jgi:hypothetical protein
MDGEVGHRGSRGSLKTSITFGVSGMTMRPLISLIFFGVGCDFDSFFLVVRTLKYKANALPLPDFVVIEFYANPRG